MMSKITDRLVVLLVFLLLAFVYRFGCMYLLWCFVLVFVFCFVLGVVFCFVLCCCCLDVRLWFVCNV